MVLARNYVHGYLISKEHEIAHIAPVCKKECHFCRQGIANKYVKSWICGVFISKHETCKHKFHGFPWLNIAIF